MAVYRLFCLFCAELFEAKSPATRYCSTPCRLKALHERNIKRYEAMKEAK